MKELPIHAHPLGCTEEEVRAHFADRMMKKFGDWIDGHTGVVVDKQFLVRPEDVAYFTSAVLERE